MDIIVIPISLNVIKILIKMVSLSKTVVTYLILALFAFSCLESKVDETQFEELESKLSYDTKRRIRECNSIKCYDEQLWKITNSGGLEKKPDLDKINHKLDSLEIFIHRDLITLIAYGKHLKNLPFSWSDIQLEVLDYFHENRELIQRENTVIDSLLLRTALRNYNQLDLDDTITLYFAINKNNTNATFFNISKSQLPSRYVEGLFIVTNKWTEENIGEPASYYRPFILDLRTIALSDTSYLLMNQKIRIGDTLKIDIYNYDREIVFY